jgi:hypothetical protein
MVVDTLEPCHGILFADRDLILETLNTKKCRWGCMGLGGFTYMYKCICTRTYIHTFMHTYIHTYIHTHGHTFVHQHVLIHAQLRTRNSHNLARSATLPLQPLSLRFLLMCRHFRQNINNNPCKSYFIYPWFGLVNINQRQVDSNKSVGTLQSLRPSITLISMTSV